MPDYSSQIDKIIAALNQIASKPVDWWQVVPPALGVVIGVLITAATQWLTRPKLRIDYEGKSVENEKGVYVRVRVRNVGQRVAKDCRLYITALHKIMGNKRQASSELVDSKMISWAGSMQSRFDSRSIPKGVNFYADVVRVLKESPGWNFAIEDANLFDSQKPLLSYKGDYYFELTVTSDNAKPALCKLVVSYSGDWQKLKAKRG